MPDVQEQKPGALVVWAGNEAFPLILVDQGADHRPGADNSTWGIPAIGFIQITCYAIASTFSGDGQASDLPRPGMKVAMEEYLFLIVFVIVAFAIIVIGIAINKSRKKVEEERQRILTNARKRVAAVKSIRKVQWREQFTIDGGVIDDDHKTLFRLVNDFNEGIINFIAPNDLIPLLTSFTEYTQGHFQREEKLQEMSRFPFFEDHKKEHQALIKKFNDLKQKALMANEDTITDVVVEIGTFLQEWLTEHVIESDLPLKPYLKQASEKAEDTGETTQEETAQDEHQPSP